MSLRAKKAAGKRDSSATRTSHRPSSTPSPASSSNRPPTPRTAAIHPPHPPQPPPAVYQTQTQAPALPQARARTHYLPPLAHDTPRRRLLPPLAIQDSQFQIKAFNFETEDFDGPETPLPSKQPLQLAGGLEIPDTPPGNRVVLLRPVISPITPLYRRINSRALDVEEDTGVGSLLGDNANIAESIENTSLKTRKRSSTVSVFVNAKGKGKAKGKEDPVIEAEREQARRSTASQGQQETVAKIVHAVRFVANQQDGGAGANNSTKAAPGPKIIASLKKRANSKLTGKGKAIELPDQRAILTNGVSQAKTAQKRKRENTQTSSTTFLPPAIRKADVKGKGKEVDHIVPETDQQAEGGPSLLPALSAAAGGPGSPVPTKRIRKIHLVLTKGNGHLKVKGPNIHKGKGKEKEVEVGIEQEEEAKSEIIDYLTLLTQEEKLRIAGNMPSVLDPTLISRSRRRTSKSHAFAQTNGHSDATPLSNEEKADKEKTLERNIDNVVFGDVIFKSWYPSWYPKEIIGEKALHGGEKGVGITVPTLYVCKKCFGYSNIVEDWVKHCRSCVKEVPGQLVYTHGGQSGSAWSVWEVDGDVDTIFCQNLSLFAKLFLDNKSVFFDVYGFNYFLLVHTSPRDGNQQIVGFFSKEKMSWDNNNLACILVFPPWQRKALGPILMGVSYEISRREQILGGPEKPISDLGKKAYRRFWGAEIARWLLEVRETDRKKGKGLVDVETISKETWIHGEDCLSVLRDMGVIENAGKGKGKEERVRIDKAAVRAWVKKENLNLQRIVDPEGFVEGYGYKNVEEEDVSG